MSPLMSTMRSRLARTGRAGLALWSCLMATAHGAAMLLVPALAPLCSAAGSAAPGSALVWTAMVVHMAAMLVAAGVAAAGVLRTAARPRPSVRDRLAQAAWAAALAVTVWWLQA